MLRDYMTDFEMKCITNCPHGITECETFPLWDFPEITPGEVKKDWDAYRRLKLFEPETGKLFGKRILSVDLDVVIEGDLNELIDYRQDFQGVSGSVSHINASLFTLKVGTNRHVWDTFDPTTAAKIIEKKRITGSDQGWMSIQMPKAYTWGHAHGVWTWKNLVRAPEKPKSRKVVAFAGNVKPWSDECKLRTKDLYMAYMDYLH